MDMTTKRRMPRGNKFASIRDDKLARRYEPHVAPINRLVDSLRSERSDPSVPYVDPDLGGVGALVLNLFQDPGPRASGTTGGSGLLSMCNDDPSAEAMCNLVSDAGLDWTVLLSWNAVPWHTAGRNGVRDRAQGADALLTLLDLLPDLRVVMTHGLVASKSWDEAAARHGPLGRYAWIPTLHPSSRGLTRGGQQLKVEGLRMLRADLERAKTAAGLGTA